MKLFSSFLRSAIALPLIGPCINKLLIVTKRRQHLAELKHHLLMLCGPCENADWHYTQAVTIIEEYECRLNEIKNCPATNLDELRSLAFKSFRKHVALHRTFSRKYRVELADRRGALIAQYKTFKSRLEALKV